jgi:hypothetical protein
MELKPTAGIDQMNVSKNSARLMASGGGLESADFIPHDEDSIEIETVLGYQLANPYTVSNMQHAYGNLGLNDGLAVVNNLYVRFLPTIDQLAALDSIMDAQGLELFDTPVNYQVLYEGDYYQDPSIPDSLPTWQYAVVPPSFQFPAGIQHQTLASIHIPGDNYTAVETEAERLASIQDSINMSGMSAMAMNKGLIPYSKEGIVKPLVPDCGPGYEWSYSLLRCVPILPEDCPPGYHWDDDRCVPDQDGPPPLQPPSAADAAIPAGYIYVHDTNLPNIASGGSNVPVRKVRVVARRWFKIERTFTDDYGHFVFTKKFKHKVRIIEKFKNGYSSIRAMRGFSLWQMLFATKRTLGIYSGNKSNINFNNDRGGPLNSKDNRYWAAATTLNSVQEYRDYAVSEGIGLPPSGLKILLSNWGSGTGATPMFAKRASNDLSAEFVSFYMSPPVQIIASVIFILKRQIDIVGSYHFGDATTDLISDNMKELFYHELTHAAHYQALGNNWYTTFVNAELFEIVSNLFSGYKPYGDGSNSQSAIIALGEGWAYHIGHYFTDKRYTNSSSDWADQGIGYKNNDPIFGLSSHLNLLENFSPYRTGDPFYWIPTGLFYDMIDARNDNLFNTQAVSDQVSGYTNQQFFNAFNSSITTLGSYSSNLLQQNGNNQSTQITSLFSQYGY